ncbi:MAG: hypothetical protein EP297_09770 [Gammaproteobacteria bacterium]|nr:MAG: hypothetical protein EP297_09770 [Gammaproteobacteria bacterium]
MHYVHVQSDSSIEKDEFFKASKALCKHQDICIVMFWDDKELMPPASEPLTDGHVASKLAHYNLNKYTGLERVAVCAVDGC